VATTVMMARESSTCRTRDGIYDLGVSQWRGQAEIEAMLAGAEHQDLLAAGCAHQVSAPCVELEGDTATVTCYQQLVRRRAGRFEIHHMSANKLDLVRTAEGWRIARRTSRLLDGRPDARALLAGSRLDEESKQ
jgi:hypothetical protein